MRVTAKLLAFVLLVALYWLAWAKPVKASGPTMPPPTGDRDCCYCCVKCCSDAR